MAGKVKVSAFSVLAILLCSQMTLQGATIIGIDLGFGASGAYYDVSTEMFGMSPALVSGAAVDENFNTYFIGQLGVATLTVDDCALIPPDLSTGGIAHAWFADNDGVDTAVVTISGHIFNPGNGSFFNGDLLILEVGGDFEAIETDDVYSILTVTQYSSVIGGELATGANMGLVFGGPACLTYYTLYTETGDGGLENFSDDDLDYIASGGGTNTNVHFEPIPEPATMLLLGLGSVSVIRKRRK